jgi:hypothetical protein
LSPCDRLLWVCLRRLWPRWRDALEFGPAGHGRPVASRRVPWILEPPFSLGRFGIHGELRKVGITVSERTVSGYLPDRLTAPSQPGGHSSRTTLGWRSPRRGRRRTRHATTTLSRPSLCSAVTRRAVPLKSVGSCRLASVAPTTAVSWLASRTEWAVPPKTRTFQLWQGPAEVVGRRTWLGGVRTKVPLVRGLHLAERSETVRF